MKFVKEINTHCPKCKRHTIHSISLYKKGKERSLAGGVRRHEREKHGYGGQKWPELKRTAKTTKKQLLKLKCKDCGYVVSRLGIRLRKLEIGA
ncbi:50S ribosomal protein L44e [[Eubacterium] cellulosolvens]|jgi:large subunit ribosomal protein L44e